VGIGTASPATKVHALTPSATAVAFRAGNSVSYAEFQVDASGNSELIAPGGVQIFNTNGAERVRITSNGNVGIASTIPAEKLSIAGNISMPGGSIYGNSTGVTTASLAVCASSAFSGGGGSAMVVRGYTAGYNNGGMEFYYGNGSTTVEAARIDSSGNLLVGYTSSNGAYKLQVNSQIFATSSTIATSDARYKQNVETLNGALSLVKALRPVSFDWKKHPVHAFDTENTTVGFLAQEVQQVLADKPYLNSIIKKNECVIEPEIKNDDGVVTTAAVTEEFLGIVEGNMIAILTAAFQELSAKNDALTARIAILEANAPKVA